MHKKDDFLFDIRVVERHIREGVITREDYEKYLKELHDISDEAIPIKIDMEEEETEKKEKDEQRS